jgi:RES domain-containing protein
VIVYRICSAKYPNNDGEGAKLYGGRWNHKGTPMLYCAETLSACVLENLVHSSVLPQNKVAISAEIPDGVALMAKDSSNLPSNWNSPAHIASTQDIGTNWVLSLASVALFVPSAIVSHERNVLINPLHPDFARIKFGAPNPFAFDPRLK